MTQQRAVETDKELMRDLLYKMVLIRRFEDKAAEMYARGKVAGFLHLYNGEEAVGVGAISVLRKEDLVVTHYRDHGHALAKGCDPKRLMAELFGKATGVSKGKGGSMHFFDASVGFLGGWAIVGGQIPLAVGLAFASKYLEAGHVVLNIFGDAATNIGEFHEALNMAALWKVPIVFLCENNLYGMGTAVSRASAVTEIARKATAYGIPGERVDGMDVLAVREVVGKAVDRARRGDGPSLIEALTYRFRGHSMADPVFYRDKAEAEEWKDRDPILQFQKRLATDGVLAAEETAAIDQEVDQVIEESVRFAEESPFPPPEALYEDVYASPPEPAEGD